MIDQNTIKQVVDLIVDEYKPERIILIGSYCKGNPTLDSDLDLIVVSDREAHLARRRRGLSILNRLKGFHFSKDILVYTNDEINQWKDVKSAFITSAISDGVVLYG